MSGSDKHKGQSIQRLQLGGKYPQVPILIPEGLREGQLELDPPPTPYQSLLLLTQIRRPSRLVDISEELLGKRNDIQEPLGQLRLGRHLRGFPFLLINFACDCWLLILSNGTKMSRIQQLEKEPLREAVIGRVRCPRDSSSGIRMRIRLDRQGSLDGFKASKIFTEEFLRKLSLFDGLAQGSFVKSVEHSTNANILSLETLESRVDIGKRHAAQISPGQAAGSKWPLQHQTSRRISRHLRGISLLNSFRPGLLPFFLNTCYLIRLDRHSGEDKSPTGKFQRKSNPDT